MQTLSLPELRNKKAETQSARGFQRCWRSTQRLKLAAYACRQAAGGPDHGAAVGAEGQRGDGAVVALQDAHTLAGVQVPQPDATVQGGGEELQAVGVGVELDQAATARRTFLFRNFVTILHTVIKKLITINSFQSAFLILDLTKF